MYCYIECIDKDQNCADLAATTNECRNNPITMKRQCCQSCMEMWYAGSGWDIIVDGKCIDTEPGCAGWVADGGCEKWPEAMFQGCCGSCKGKD